MSRPRVADLSPEDFERAKARAVARKIGLSRTNPSEMFSFVMREETTRDPIITLPHQEVLFDFTMQYDRSVVRMPVGFSKTYCMSALTLWLLGQDATARGVVISSTQLQAQKPVGMVRDYIEVSDELKLVFPELRRSPREKDWWTQTKLVVERPPGIRDPSLTAVGVEGALPGSRLSWLLVDDILDPENTSTPQARAKVRRWFNKVVLSRRDVANSKIVVTNTPYDPEDLTYALEKSGWPTLTMNIEGGIFLSNAADFESPLLRESELVVEDEEKKTQEYRLIAHDTVEHVDDAYPSSAPPEVGRDIEDRVPLWPERYGRNEIDRLRDEYADAMTDYNQLYMCICRSDESGRVKVEWITKAKTSGRELEVYRFVSKLPKELEDCPTFTGIDLGVSKRNKSGRTSIFTFAVQPDRRRRILDIDMGRFSGKDIVTRIIRAHERFNSIGRVENNAAQDYLRQWVLEEDITIPIRSHTTGKNKRDPRFGVESIFVEIENGVWIFPCDPMGRVPEPIQVLIDDMLYYDPDGHTGDILMSMWLAREQARSSGALARDYKHGQVVTARSAEAPPGAVAALLAR